MNAYKDKLKSGFQNFQKEKLHKDSWSNVAFVSKVNIRRKLKPKNTKFGTFLDFKNDFPPINSEEVNAQNLPPFPEVNEVGQLSEEFLDGLQLFFLTGGILPRKYIYKLLAISEDFFRSSISSTVIDIGLKKDAVVNVCGDIHGQYYDLIKILRIQGRPSEKNLYLFNGDIVDKGPRSLECILLLFTYKLVYPYYVYINRGNHESTNLNIKNGFRDEINKKYGGEHQFDDQFILEFFGDIFRWMPIAHLINHRIFVVHGGLSGSPTLAVEDIRNKQRPLDADDDEIVAGTLWSDPVSKPGITDSSRGIGFFFGPDITKQFLENNDLKCIIRSHTEIRSGCTLAHEGCYTVFSAPNKEKGILGGVLVVEASDDLDIKGNVFTDCDKEEALCLMGDETFSSLLPLTQSLKELDMGNVIYEKV